MKIYCNHHLLMRYSAYVYVPMGLPATDRAKLLGHSVDTNLRHYTFARTDDYIDILDFKAKKKDLNKRKKG